MLKYAVADFVSKVKPLAVVFEKIDHAQRLLVMFKPVRIEFVQSALTRMSERSMPQIVSERDRLSQILV